jgi:hypothetical protein
MRHDRFQREEAERMGREWNELHGCTDTQQRHPGGLSGMTEEIRRRTEERRKAFAKAAAAIFQPSRPNATVRRIVESRERFEKMAEACFPAARSRASWMFQTASEYRGSPRNEGLARGELP